MKFYYIPLEIWKQKDLIIQFTLRDLHIRYKGSYLGVLWSLLTPLFMLAIYSFVFTQVFKAKWAFAGSDQPSFSLLIFTGMIVFQIFSEPVNRASTIITSQPNLIKKVVFPAEVLPISIVMSGLINSCFAFIVLLAAALVMGHLSLTVIYLPLVLLPIILLTAGTALVIAVLGVYIRDMSNFISILINAVYFMSPVFYPVSAVPKKFQTIMYINPLTSVIENSRNVILNAQPPVWTGYVLHLFISLVIFIIGYKFFCSSKEMFADAI
ncbi:lipopolysaccharide transport system permease protein [Desulfohalotomaculum tongense]|uniref:ABC transporter permease n=1 Tax=Desulforadius tongensis TaxID=1216062 RepID=UPI00195CF1AA|nr:ABC transporter permease [Desulforadius tongensis]MBM7853715.1 lipopolysaccharide transport system permease protein [Desulforadius tongensis]